jgi:hypothetical protein
MQNGKEEHMKTIFCAFVCVLSFITLRPLTSWSAEASNPFFFGSALAEVNPFQSGTSPFSGGAVGAPPDILWPAPPIHQPSGNSVFENLFTDPFGDTDGLLPPPDGLLPAPVSDFPWTQFVIPSDAEFERQEIISVNDNITTIIKSLVLINPANK